ncbi:MULTISPECIES: PTS sugar transporter subunit IIA [Cellulomonas]|uniref:Putative PTS IIA-like nitrogen-regulatory protein PtsN n=1 Tax=Cellulomonas gilvus (strain ATCC 13127 / NRRL B-14078) TaxID=593907 RepID=F7ZZZ5_CELGA|nr:MULTISPECIES: PTS sugar transporter subunit IIA [Cellulomonas]AEI11414.1 putative PTS IIA-like nitrogen-regulatory protein PtsN [Cellulomonas gilvus ATCC 13127]MCR6690729.1 PTS sugar transporter subunit IIA [Cellulomonas sp.]
MSTPLITPGLVALDLVAADRDEVTRHLADLLVAEGRVTDAAGFLDDVRAREAQMPTGMPGGVGLPHARSAHVTAPSLVVGRLAQGVDWGAPDGPATLVFLIAAPATGDADHLQILAALARRLVHQSFRDSLREAPDAQTVADVVTREVVPS